MHKSISFLSAALVLIVLLNVFSVCHAQTARTRSLAPAGKALPAAPGKSGASEVPLSIFGDIEQGWKAGSVDGILGHFGKGKVALSISGAGPKGGYFSKNQSYYLFKDLFKYTITKKFEFTQYRNIHDGDRKVYAVAERQYKRRDDGRLYQDKIYVSLQRENERWVISEIKSVR
ncbi:MAG: DUF4783 domain-containing protein [Chitinivibrionia bacterium]|nr:DUF4783 domain-containing protein [Chitinivibrionia bacterium]